MEGFSCAKGVRSEKKQNNEFWLQKVI